MTLKLTREMRELDLEELLLLREELEEEDDELTLELLELEDDLVLFFRPGTKIFWSFRRTLSSWIISSSLMLITLIIFSAAFSPT